MTREELGRKMLRWSDRQGDTDLEIQERDLHDITLALRRQIKKDIKGE